MSKNLVNQLQRPRKRLTELLFKAAMDPPTEKQLDLWGTQPEKEWHLKLLRTPKEIHSDSENRLCGVTLGINKLSGNEVSEDQTIEATEATEKIECGLLLRSIGYVSVPVEEGIPYDEKKGIIPNKDGFVEDGLYCAGKSFSVLTEMPNQSYFLLKKGWLATGPRGVIVDTMSDAFKVGQTVTSHLSKLNSVSHENGKTGFSVIEPLLRRRNVRSVSFQDWQRIDAEEKRKGGNFGKPREKFTFVHDMMAQLD